jgi:hypothetical protein
MSLIRGSPALLARSSNLALTIGNHVPETHCFCEALNH